MSRPLGCSAGMSVLAFDDDPADAEDLQLLLTRGGLERVYTETDSRKVQRLFARHKPDLVPVEDSPALQRAPAPLRSLGARPSNDDIGSGYSGFRHLLRLWPDIINLDISLVTGIDRNHDQRALTRARPTFAHEVGAQVNAEGIEEPAELTTLQDLGVPWGQGYLISRPAPRQGVRA